MDNANKTNEAARESYISRVLGYGRTNMLRTLHAGGVKQGRGRHLSDREIAAVMWSHFGRRSQAVRP